METVLQTYGLTKQYGSFTALSNLDLALKNYKNLFIYSCVCFFTVSNQTVNLLRFASMVRIHLLPPKIDKSRKGFVDFTY